MIKHTINFRIINFRNITKSFFVAAALSFTGCSLFGSSSTPPHLFDEPKGENVVSISYGVASFYGPGFHGRKTANGETFDQDAFTAAHKKLPFGTVIKVTDVTNGRSVKVRINDRGPFISGRDIDVSQGVAKRLGFIDRGVVNVKLEILDFPKPRYAKNSSSVRRM
jgi:rare lipoprotein A